MTELNSHLQVLGRPECDFLAGLDLDGFAGGRIAPHTGGALPDLQDAQPGNADSFTLLEMLGDGTEDAW